MKIWIWRRIEKIKWTDHVSSEEKLQRVGEKRQLINHIRERQAKWIGHVMRDDTLLKEVYGHLGDNLTGQQPTGQHILVN